MLTDLQFPYRLDARKVCVAGSFNGWVELLCDRQDAYWSVSIDSLDARIISFKWIVDGEWLTSDNYSTDPDENGNINNVLKVEHVSAITPTVTLLPQSNGSLIAHDVVDVVVPTGEAVNTKRIEITAARQSNIEFAQAQLAKFETVPSIMLAGQLAEKPLIDSQKFQLKDVARTGTTMADSKDAHAKDSSAIVSGRVDKSMLDAKKAIYDRNLPNLPNGKSSATLPTAGDEKLIKKAKSLKKKLGFGAKKSLEETRTKAMDIEEDAAAAAPVIKKKKSIWEKLLLMKN